MCHALAGKAAVESMRQRMHWMVNNFCDHHRQSQGAQQERLVRQELANGFNEITLETLDRHLQDNNQESSPLLPEVRQELRSRVWKSSVLDVEEEEDAEVQDAERGFCDRVLRWFQRLLCQLQRRWEAALAWVKQKVAAGLQAFCDAVEAVWSALKSACASLAQVFGTCAQA